MKQLKSVIAALFLISPFAANAGPITVVGDVNADIAANWAFYDSILGSGQSVLFSRQDYAQSELKTHYNTLAGVTASESAATLNATLLSGVDMLVVTQTFNQIFQLPVYSASEYAAVSSYLQGGGSLLMIVEASATAPLASYNSFLTGIGSSIQLTGRGSSTETIKGVFGDFKVNGTSSTFSGGNAAYVAAGLGTVVATDSVPEPETWILMLSGLALIGFAAQRRKLPEA